MTNSSYTYILKNKKSFAVLLFEPSRKKTKQTNIGLKVWHFWKFVFFWRKSHILHGTNHHLPSNQILPFWPSKRRSSCRRFPSPADRQFGRFRHRGMSRATTGSDRSMVGDVPKRLAVGQNIWVIYCWELQSQAFSNGWKWWVPTISQFKDLESSNWNNRFQRLEFSHQSFWCAIWFDHALNPTWGFEMKEDSLWPMNKNFKLIL